MRRVRSLRQWMPEVELPELSEEEIKEWLPELCSGCRSFDELRKLPWVELMRGKLSHKQLAALRQRERG